MAEIQCQNEVDSPRTPGQIIFGKYEKGRLVGQGNFGKVYLGKTLVTNESVAIKVIKKEQVEKDGMMEQIKREISVMGLVRHPNIVELKEIMATKTKIYIVMEYVKGGELFEKIRRGRLKEDVARKYFQQLISAVDFCHSRGVYHRDLKPENLLLDDNGDLKVTDFGLAALHEHSGHDGMLHTQCGTPAYIAPEVLRRRGYDGVKADIWSCGVILFVLLAGFLPFQHESRTKMFMKIFKAEYECPPWFSPDTKRLISKLLIVDPKRRIAIPIIMKAPWFKKGFTRPFAFSLQESGIGGVEMGEHSRGDLDPLRAMRSPPMKSPPFFNAFEFISSMSSGFDLSAMFQSERKSGSLFTSKMAPNVVIQNLEALANKLNFMVHVKNFKVKMQGNTEGRKGKLLVTAEVYKVAPEVTVVEFSKSSGDTLEYNKFCEEDIRPALKDIVWTWQGEESSQ